MLSFIGMRAAGRKGCSGWMTMKFILYRKDVHYVATVYKDAMICWSVKHQK